MRTTTAVVLTIMALALAGCCTKPVPSARKSTYSSFDLPCEHPVEDIASRLTYEAKDAALPDILKIYEQVSGRTVIAGSLAPFKVSFRSSTALNRIEALQMLDSVLAQHGIAMVLSGEKNVKAVFTSRVSIECPPEITLPWRLLPESNSPMSRTIKLRYLRPSEAVPALAALSNLPNSILPIDSQKIIVLRDYSSNIRKMLKLLEEIDRAPSIRPTERCQALRNH